MTMKDTYYFDEPINRIGSGSYKWDTEGEGGKRIPLGVADTDFRCPDPVIRAVCEKAEFGIYAYHEFPEERFQSAVAGWYRKRYGISLEQEAVCHSQGIMTGALWMLLLALTDPGDTVIIQEPVYHNFRIITENMGRKVISNPLLFRDGRYEMDWEDLEAKAEDPSTRMLLICNPHNPVGRVWTKEELSRLCKICEKNHILIVSDEMHGDIVYKGHVHTPVFSIPGAEKFSIVMSGPGKTFNLSGFYSAYVVIQEPSMRRAYEKVYHQFHFDHNFMGTEALITAYNECEDYVDQQNEYFAENIRITKEFLGEHIPELHIIEPEGGYLLWMDCRKWGLPQEELLGLFAGWGVQLNDGSMYGTGGNGFLRVNIATQREVLLRALECIKAGYDQWKKNI